MTTFATNAEELKRLQAPLKARYREEPAAARQRFRAAGVTVNVVATAMGIPFCSARVIVEGESGSAERSAFPGTSRSASPTSTCASRAIPRPRTKNWPSCCGRPSAIA